MFFVHTCALCGVAVASSSSSASLITSHVGRTSSRILFFFLVAECGLYVSKEWFAWTDCAQQTRHSYFSSSFFSNDRYSFAHFHHCLNMERFRNGKFARARHLTLFLKNNTNMCQKRKYIEEKYEFGIFRNWPFNYCCAMILWLLRRILPIWSLIAINLFARIKTKNWTNCCWIQSLIGSIVCGEWVLTKRTPISIGGIDRWKYVIAIYLS